LVATAKAAWLVRPDDSAERVQRALDLVREDQRQGVSAMLKAVGVGASSLFQSIADVFEGNRTKLQAAGSNLAAASKKPPSDERLIRDLGLDVDRYYGVDGTTADLQLLWNIASSLSHGERWHSLLTGRNRGNEAAQILTTRSIDAVCSAINVTSLRILWLASSPPK
jgi:hypothetical protein